MKTRSGAIDARGPEFAKLAAQPGRFDRQLLHAGEEDLVDAPLPLEVVAVELVEPAEERHQQALLDEDDRGTRGAAVALIRDRRFKTPRRGVAEQLRQQQRGRLTPLDRDAQQRINLGEKGGILVTPESVDELAEALRRVRSPEVRQAYASGGAAISRNFSLDRMAEQFAEIYENLWSADQAGAPSQRKVSEQ